MAHLLSYCTGNLLLLKCSAVHPSMEACSLQTSNLQVQRTCVPPKPSTMPPHVYCCACSAPGHQRHRGCPESGWAISRSLMGHDGRTQQAAARHSTHAATRRYVESAGLSTAACVGVTSHTKHLQNSQIYRMYQAASSDPQHALGSNMHCNIHPFQEREQSSVVCCTSNMMLCTL